MQFRMDSGTNLQALKNSSLATCKICCAKIMFINVSFASSGPPNPRCLQLGKANTHYPFERLIYIIGNCIPKPAAPRAIFAVSIIMVG